MTRETCKDNIHRGRCLKQPKKKQNSSTDFQKETDLGVDLTKGFFDTQEDALAGNPDPEYSKENESELNRLARGEKIEKTVEEYKKKD